MEPTVDTKMTEPPLALRRRIALSLSPMKFRAPVITTTTSAKETPARPSNNNNNNNNSNAKVPRCGIAMNGTETILVSASGDVLVCRCRESSSPYLRGDLVSRRSKGNLRQWWEHDCDALTNRIGDVVLTSPCCGNQRPLSALPSKPGLRGGGSRVLENVPNKEKSRRLLLEEAPVKNSTESLEEKKQDEEPLGEAEEQRDGVVIPSLLDGENELLFPLPSFDYSHFADDGNDMIPMSQRSQRLDRLEAVPEHREREDDGSPRRHHYHHHHHQDVGDREPSEATTEAWHESLCIPDFFHGVPVFHPAFSQIHITQVSANPFGSHVLLISREALLFAYGLNNHGQLGNGQRTKVNGPNRGFVTTPILVTPLLESGGKALKCAAGRNHSLVVVMTEGRRVGKMRHSTGGRDSASDVTLELTRRASSGSRPRIDTRRANSNYEDEHDSMVHHQLYAFGSNKFMKLGLLNPSSSSKRNGSSTSSNSNESDDVLLPRRVALHCSVWPADVKSGDGGTLPTYGIFDIAASCEHSAALVRRATGDMELYTWGNGASGALGLDVSQLRSSILDLATRVSCTPSGARDKAEGKAIVPVPTLVTSLSYVPGRESVLMHTSEFPTCVALGNTCSYVATSRGRCFSFGTSEAGMLGVGPGVITSPEAIAISFPTASSRSGKNACINSISVGVSHVVAQATDGSAYAWGKTIFKESESHSDFSTIAWQPERVQIPVSRNVLPTKTPNVNTLPLAADSNNSSKLRVKVAHVCAGLDATIFVTESGEVLSCGRMSGQLGLGELRSDVVVPTPMLGGLRLWQNQKPPSVLLLHKSKSTGDEPSVQQQHQQ